MSGEYVKLVEQFNITLLESYYKTVELPSSRPVEVFKNLDSSEIRMFVKKINDSHKLYGSTPRSYTFKIFIDENDYYAVSPDYDNLHNKLVAKLPEFGGMIWGYLDLDRNLKNAEISWSGNFGGFTKEQREIIKNNKSLNSTFDILIRENYI